MSINYKKMANLIEEEVNKMPDLSSFQRERLVRLSNKIYALESSIDAISNQKMTEEIRSEISLASSDFFRNGEE